MERGEVKVAKYYPRQPIPKTPGYRNVLIHTQSKNLGGGLSPYQLRNEDGQILENVWQFSKLYPKVRKQRIPLSRFHPNTIIWEHPEEIHIDENGYPTDEYWIWREKGMNNDYAVRYPNGFYGRHTCICSLWPDKNGEYQRLDYVESRKQIYCSEYIRLAPKTQDYQKLYDMLQKGTNLQIVEVDGPDPTLDYYPFDSISNSDPGLTINETVIRRLLHDTRKPFGHGYTIASILLDGQHWLQ